MTQASAIPEIAHDDSICRASTTSRGKKQCTVHSIGLYNDVVCGVNDSNS